MGSSAGLLPQDETARLAAVRRYGILDTEREEAFDRLTALTARLLDAPIAMLSIVDSERVWVKSRLGTDIEYIDRRHGMCSRAILGDEPYVVTDAAEDAQWRDSPMVAQGGLRFYAGAPLRTGDGHALGALGVCDVKPRQPTLQELETLRDLASIAMHQLDLRLAGLGEAGPEDATSDTVSWEDPPLRKVRPPEEWAPLLAQVSQRPGHWAKLRHYSGETSAYRAASQLRDRDDLPEGHWEFLARRSPEGGSDLFARVSAAEPGDRKRRY